MQQIQDGEQALKLHEKSLGISEAQAQTQYQNALQQLGLNNTMTVDQLKSQIYALAGGGYSPMAGFMGTLASLIPQLNGIIQKAGGK